MKRKGLPGQGYLFGDKPKTMTARERKKMREQIERETLEEALARKPLVTDPLTCWRCAAGEKPQEHGLCRYCFMDVQTNSAWRAKEQQLSQ